MDNWLQLTVGLLQQEHRQNMVRIQQNQMSHFEKRYRYMEHILHDHHRQMAEFIGHIDAESSLGYHDNWDHLSQSSKVSSFIIETQKISLTNSMNSANQNFIFLVKCYIFVLSVYLCPHSSYYIIYHCFLKIIVYSTSASLCPSFSDSSMSTYLWSIHVHLLLIYLCPPTSDLSMSTYLWSICVHLPQLYLFSPTSGLFILLSVYSIL